MLRYPSAPLSKMPLSGIRSYPKRIRRQELIKHKTHLVPTSKAMRTVCWNKTLNKQIRMPAKSVRRRRAQARKPPTGWKVESSGICSRSGFSRLPVASELRENRRRWTAWPENRCRRTTFTSQVPPINWKLICGKIFLYSHQNVSFINDLYSTCEWFKLLTLAWNLEFPVE